MALSLLDVDRGGRKLSTEGISLKRTFNPGPFPFFHFSGHSKVRLSSTALYFCYELLSDHSLKINGPTDNELKYPNFK